MMFRTLVRKEYLSQIISLRFGLTAGLGMALIVASLVLGGMQSGNTRREQRALDQNHRLALDSIAGEKIDYLLVYRLYVWEGRTYVIPRSELSSVVQGLTPIYPSEVNATAKTVIMSGRDPYKNPVQSLFMEFDYAYIIQAIISLVALLLTFDAICGEKESGTLRILSSYGVPKHLILLSKWVASSLVLATPLLLGSAMGLAYLWWSGILPFWQENLIRLALLLAAVLLYGSIFVLIGLLVSSLTKRGATSVLVCLFIWGTLVICIPNLAPLAAEVLSPALSGPKLAAELRAIDDETQSRIRAAYQSRGKPLIADDPQLRAEAEKLKEAGTEKKRRWEQEYVQSTKRQRAWAQNLGRLSPATSWALLSSELTRTGLSDLEMTEDGVQRLPREFLAIYKANPDVKAGISRQMLARLTPTLTITTASLSSSLRTAAPDVILLAAVNIALFLGTWVAFLRYDVR